MVRRKADGRRIMEINKTTAAILAGEEDVSTWSLEELLRGQKRSADGKFHGRQPDVVARGIVQEILRRRGSQSLAKMAGALPHVADGLVEIACDPKVDAHARIKAAHLIFLYTLGKPPEQMNVNITADDAPKWARVLQQALVVDVVASAPEDIVDAELAEDPSPETW